MSEPRGKYVKAGAVWRNKRDRWRRVEIVRVTDEYVYVERNTSRRTQPILRTTLLRDYEPYTV